MGKNEFLTPKAIANRIKAKGLQKLRWYCQMCQKQCRDENGFKCHCMSESHQRQMQVFGDNPNRFIDGFSQEFEKSFLEHVKRSHRFSRVAATVLYNEYISDRHHIHMNSTQWATLTEFVKHLGRTGKCKVDETEKGWFVTYIDREPETLLREALKNKRERSEMADEERHEREIQKQIDRASKSGRFGDTAENDGVNENDDGDGHRDDGDPHLKEKKLLQRSSEDEKVVFSFNTSKLKGNPEETSVTKSGINRSVPFEEGSIASKDIQENKSSSHSRSTIKDLSDQSSHNSQKSSAIAREDGKRSTSGIGGAGALEQLMAEEEKAKEKANRKDYWLTEGLVVKVMSKSLIDQGLYKQKGVVTKVIEKYAGRIKMLESGMVVQVDQAELETVIPQIGGIVKIVNGAYRGSNARLLSINTSNFTAKVQIEKGMYDGRVLNAVEYEDICKFSA